MTRHFLLAAVAGVVGIAASLPTTAQAFYFPGWPGSGIPPPKSLTPPGSNNPPSSRTPPKRPPEKPPEEPPKETPEPASAIAGLIGLAMIGLRTVRRRK